MPVHEAGASISRPGIREDRSAWDERLLLAAVLAAVERIESKIEEKIMAALDDLKAADQALQTEVATFLTDIATALSAEDPDIEQVVTDINTQISALQAGDPAAAAAPPVTPPAGS